MTKQQTFGRSRPSIAYELEYRRALEKLIAEMSKDVQETIQTFLDNNVAMDSREVRLQQIMKALRQKWYRVFEKRGRELARWFAEKTDKRTMSQIMRKFRQVGFTLQPHYTKEQKAIISDIINANVQMIKSIPQVYLREVQQAVNASFIAGGNLQTLTKELKPHVARAVKSEAAAYAKSIKETEGITPRWKQNRRKKWLQHLIETMDKRTKERTILLARDQSNKVTQTYAVVNAQALGANKGRWIHVPGKYSSRETHIHMDKKQFDLNVGLYDSDVGRYVKPGELPYCNCQFSVLMPGFDD